MPIKNKLDESTACRQLKSPRSLSGRSMKIHGQSHVCGQRSRSHLTFKIQTDHIWGLEFNRYVCFSFCGNRATFGWDIGNCIFDLENSWSRSWPRSNLMVTFEALSSTDMLVFVSWQSDHCWLRYRKFYIWLWKFKVIQGQGHGQGQTLWSHLGPWVQSICLLFRGNRTIFGWEIAKSIFDLENSRSRSWPRSNPMITLEA